MAKNDQKIGWIGMGRMGFPMAERLLRAGHDVCTHAAGVTRHAG